MMRSFMNGAQGKSIKEDINQILSSARQPPLLALYLAWVEAWLSPPEGGDTKNEPSNIPQLFREMCVANPPLDQVKLVVIMFKQDFAAGKITLGGTCPPSCDSLNLLSEKYDPRTSCECDGLDPTSAAADKLDLETLLETCSCLANRRMLQEVKLMGAKPDQWNGHDIFTLERLEKAAIELILSNSEIQKAPLTCQGKCDIPEIRAPDRRPNPACDSSLSIHNEIFPTFERHKICADAKYFYAIACGGSLCDHGVARALADSGNHILIGDYGDAVDEETLMSLQRTGAAAIAFLRVCTLVGVLQDWQFDLLIAGTLQFGVLGYYRDHSRPRLAGGFYGSRLTTVETHRCIDLGFIQGLVLASVASEQRLTPKNYSEIVEACALLNDLIDLRSDITRKQRENVVLRGVRGFACKYLNYKMTICIGKVAHLIKSGKLTALVAFAFCNWSFLASHHKVWELIKGLKEVEGDPICEYDGLEVYNTLLQALVPYGTLGDRGPRIEMKRSELDLLYDNYRSESETHLAWLADVTRILLNPSHFRRIIDVVHFEWNGSLGDLNYCP